MSIVHSNINLYLQFSIFLSVIITTILTSSTSKSNSSTYANNFHIRTLTTSFPITKIKFMLTSTQQCLTVLQAQDFNSFSLSTCADNNIGQKFELPTYDSNRLGYRIKPSADLNYAISENTLSATVDGEVTLQNKAIFSSSPSLLVSQSPSPLLKASSASQADHPALH